MDIVESGGCAPPVIAGDMSVDGLIKRLREALEHVKDENERIWISAKYARVLVAYFDDVDGMRRVLGAIRCTATEKTPK